MQNTANQLLFNHLHFNFVVLHLVALAVFCCFTGLAFSDLSGLSREHIVMDNSERMWIRKKRQKTDVMCNIPLLDVALRIMEKYHDPRSERVLPVISNTKMNAYLKEIMDVCGIQKSVSTHVASHTANHYSLKINLLHLAFR